MIIVRTYFSELTKKKIEKLNSRDGQKQNKVSSAQ